MTSMKMALLAHLAMQFTIVELTADPVAFNATYKKVGILNTSLASSFDLLPGHTGLIRCITMCPQAGCPMTAWGNPRTGEGECWGILRAPLSDSTMPLPLHSISSSLTLYVNNDNNLSLHQYTFALLLFTQDEVSWHEFRAFCRGYGLEMFTPSSKEEIEALRGDFPVRTWTGANDLASEGTWVKDDGSAFPMNLFGRYEPNNLGGNQDCGVLRNHGGQPGDYDDSDCGELNVGFCTVGH